MAITTSELTQMIAEQVTKEVSKKLVPKLRRIVREEIDRSIKDMLYEMVIKQQVPLRNNNVIKKFIITLFNYFSFFVFLLGWHNLGLSISH